MTTILIVAAHSDDEALGCGGTIARHVSKGDEVHVVFMADGVTSRQLSTQIDTEHRASAAEKAAEILGIKQLWSLNLPDNRLDSLPLLDVIQPLERLIDCLKPQIVYTHHHGDLNIDHQVTHRAAMTACRPLPASTVTEIYTFETLSSSEWPLTASNIFEPDLFINIENYIDIKLRALEAYAEEMRAAPHSRSFEHIKVLSAHRGYCVGLHNAEAFSTVRKVVRD